MALNLASGQLSSSSATLLGAVTTYPRRTRVTITCNNTSASSTETVVLSLSVAGGTSRQLARVSLAPYETLVVDNLALDDLDVLSGYATDASTVDYVISEASGGKLEVFSLDANGALKQSNSGVSGNQSITGDLTVGGGDLDLGSSGAAGSLDVFPATASKGKLRLVAADSAGDTTTTLTNASQAAARTYTIPDAGGSAKFLLSAQTLGSNGLFATPLPLGNFKNLDGSAVAASPGAGVFGYDITLGTSLALIGETSNNNTKTDDAFIEYVLPPHYIAGEDLTVTVHASIVTAGSPTYATKTVQVLAFLTDSDGTQGSDLGPGSASAITVAGADVTFTVTGTTLSPGDRLVFQLETVLHDTGAVDCHASISSVRVS